MPCAINIFHIIWWLLKIAGCGIRTPLSDHFRPINFGRTHANPVRAHWFKRAVCTGLKDASWFGRARCGRPRLLLGALLRSNISRRSGVNLLKVAASGSRQVSLVGETWTFLLNKGAYYSLVPTAAGSTPMAHIAKVGRHAGRSHWSWNRIWSLQVGPGFKHVDSVSCSGWAAMGFAG